MVALVLAVTVGMFFACGTYLILRRGQIKLILGLGLLSHGVNLLLFGSGILTRRAADLSRQEELQRRSRNSDLCRPSAPGPDSHSHRHQFRHHGLCHCPGNRRHTISNTDVVYGELSALLREGDPFDMGEDSLLSGSRAEPDYDWLAYEVDEIYDRDEIVSGAVARLSEEDESAAMEADSYQ